MLHRSVEDIYNMGGVWRRSSQHNKRLWKDANISIRQLIYDMFSEQQ